MDPQFFSILGVIPTREIARGGLNERDSEHHGETWRLGVVPDSLVAAFHRPAPESRGR
ncbi:hypothetical protein [uncultured Microbacterium sp.]|jgi:hypothetical protein|uniref:hypothetical protein n=1 Tax=uncultured Microbacterium sp. TaxID=191216 RepID=UPI0028D71863|nr:hypothetical protein [uncultured Microbacterium sp.]